MKNFLIILLLFVGISYSYGQKTKGNKNGDCRYTKNLTDEFTTDRIAITEPYVIYDKSVLKGGWSITEAIENSYRLSLGVTANSKNGSNSIDFTYLVTDGAPSNERYFTFNEVYLMLDNEEIIKLKGENSVNSTDDKMDWFFNSLEFPISDKDWAALKEKAIKKIRLTFDDGNNGRTLEIKEKNANLISKAINCIDVLGIPITNKSENKNAPKNESASISEMPKPTYDTTSISLYKQWNARVILGKDGTPLRLQSKSYFIFNKDGTYNVITVTKEDRKINSKGKFELINDNKLIVFYPEEASIPSYTAIITKLTNKELEIKGEIFDTFYTVY